MEIKINYIGFIGWGNLGDEALYEVNKKLFYPYKFKQDLIILKNIYKKIHCLSNLPFNKIHNLYFPVNIFGGGTVLPEWLDKAKPNKLNYAFGVGVRNPIFWGEYQKELIEKVKAFPFRMLGVRGYTSKNILEKWGIKSEVIGDPALLLKPKNVVERNPELIVINVGSIWTKRWGDGAVLSNEIGRICKALNKRGYQPVLMPVWKRDIDTINKISEYTNTPVFRDWKDIQKTIDFISSCQILIGEKLHASVFSAATYTPFITLEYQPKCRDFTDSLDYKGYIIRTNDVTCEKILDMVYDLEGDWGTVNKLLFNKVNFYRGKLINFSEKIKKDIQKVYPFT